MAVTKIISSGTPGTESAALDVAMRFNVSYGGYTNQGSLIPGDRPAGRYTLDEKPFVHPMMLLRANLEQSDGILIFSSGPVPPNVSPLLPYVFDRNHPHLHIDFSIIKPHPAAFRIGTWVATHALSRLFITGASIHEDRGIYQLVHDALTSFFMLGTDPPMPQSDHTLH